MRPSDLDAYGIPKECRLEMSDADIKYGQDLLQEDFIKARVGDCSAASLPVYAPCAFVSHRSCCACVRGVHMA